MQHLWPILRVPWYRPSIFKTYCSKGINAQINSHSLVEFSPTFLKLRILFLNWEKYTFCRWERGRFRQQICKKTSLQVLSKSRAQFLKSRSKIGIWNSNVLIVHSVFKGKLSDSFTNYNYVGNTKVSVSIKKT